MFSTGSSSDYLNNTSFIVKEVTSNTFKVAVANTSVIPTSNVSTLKYAAKFSAAGGYIDTQYNVTGTNVKHLACYNNNNIFEPGDVVKFYAGSTDTASLNGTTSEVVFSSGGSIGVTINRPPREGRMAFIKSPDNISIELLQQGDNLEVKEPWSSMKNIGTW